MKKIEQKKIEPYEYMREWERIVKKASKDYHFENIGKVKSADNDLLNLGSAITLLKAVTKDEPDTCFIHQFTRDHPGLKNTLDVDGIGNNNNSNDSNNRS